ncbi:2-ketogluconate reductase [Polaromonas vacuolata]|uniref:2-ketogluconate reductase n=1 Tax=Polaromonas vacuolata TaxID=37448 RepID=A0A6H2HBD0_9BURK|nr:2-ketogluconate reductase [Polaromonas vacuolata]
MTLGVDLTSSLLPSSRPRPQLLAVSKLAPFFLAPLQEHYDVHERLHETDTAAFDKIAGSITAIVGGGESKVPDALLARLPALEIISIMGVGYDGVDVESALQRKIAVTHTPGVLNDEVADLAIGLMLSVARRIPQADQYVRAGRWAKEGAMPLARKVSGARLGIVGLGRIGQAIANRAAAFGMSIAYTARSQKSNLSYAYFPDTLHLAKAVDFLILITPGGSATQHLVNAEVLAALGSEGYLINVARGSVVDEAALVSALENGVIAGAGLDVFEAEPRPLAALLLMDNVVLTPHMASATIQTRQAMADLAVANLGAHYLGSPLLSAIPEML